MQRPLPFGHARRPRRSRRRSRHAHAESRARGTGRPRMRLRSDVRTSLRTRIRGIRRVLRDVSGRCRHSYDRSYLYTMSILNPFSLCDTSYEFEYHRPRRRVGVAALLILKRRILIFDIFRCADCPVHVGMAFEHGLEAWAKSQSSTCDTSRPGRTGGSHDLVRGAPGGGAGA